MMHSIIGTLNSQKAGGFDSYVKSLLHFNGTDASTIFTDEAGKTWTAHNSYVATTDKKFGTAAGWFNGVNGYIDTPDSADFDVGSGDFTIDFWVRRYAAGPAFISGQSDSSGNSNTISTWIRFDADNKPLFSICSGTKTYSTSIGSAAVTADSTWHHIACVRYGNTLTLYLDGVAQGTANVTGKTANNSTYKFAIGRIGEYSSAYFKGWIDEFRFSKGIARWTSNFTPPQTEYSA